MVTATIHKLENLDSLAFDLFKAYPSYTTFTLQGDLGAGKTTFVKSLTKALGSTQKVTSPTFSLVNEYALPNGDSIYHMDLYRLEDEEELLNVGFEDYLYKKGFCFIEWPEIALPYLQKYIEIKIIILDTGARVFNFLPHNLI